MKRLVDKKVIIIWWSIVITAMLAGCNNNNDTTKTNNDNNWVAIQDVVKWKEKVKADGTLSLEEKKKQEEANKKKAEESMKKAQENMTKEIDKLGEQIKTWKVKDVNNLVNELQNLSYNKHLLPKEEQAKLEKMEKTVKTSLLKKAIKEVQSSKLNKQTKIKLINILKSKVNADISNVNSFTQNVDMFINNKTVTSKEDIKDLKKKIAEQTKEVMAQTNGSYDNIKEVWKLVNKTNIKSIIKNGEVKQVDGKTVAEVKKILTEDLKNEYNIYKQSLKGQKDIVQLSKTDLDNIAKLIQNPTAIKTMTKDIIDENFVGTINIAYVVYKGKKIDIVWVADTIKDYNTLSKVWVKTAIILSKTPDGFYVVSLGNTNNLSTIVKALEVVKTNPEIVSLVATMYNVDTATDIAQKLIDFISWTFVDYTRIKDYDTLNKVIELLK